MAKPADQPSASELYESGLARHRQSDLQGAAERYDAAIARDRRHAKALQMRGIVHLQQGNPAEAIIFIKRGIAIDPKDAGAYGNLTAAFLQARRFDEAIEAARQATKLNPKSADYLANLGNAYTRRARFEEAVEVYQRAVKLDPKRAGLHSALGSSLSRLKRHEQALEAHRRAIALAPDRPEYLNNMTVTLRGMGLNAEAEQHLREVIASRPDDAELKASLGLLLRKRGKNAEAVATLEEASRQHGPSRLDNTIMFIKNYVDETSIEAQLDQAVRNAERVAGEVTRYTAHTNVPDPDRIIRVGLISKDFRHHAVGLFLMNTLRAIDPGKIDLYVYSGSDSDDDAFNVEFRSFLPNWRPTYGWSDAKVAERIRSDAIDILVDLSGPTAGSRLKVFAMKPAPIALGWLGYSGTTGLAAIDYIMGDAEVLPEGVEQTTETPWRLPDAYLCFSPQPEAPEVGPTPALKNGFITFGTLNNTSKISAATFDTWARILAAVPNSRLHLKAQHREDTAEAKARFLEEFTRRGIAFERITLLDWVDGWLTHLPLYHDFDIALDPFPYNGTTTTCETLHMGVPVVTLRGDRFISRVGATILHNAGLDQLIADDLEVYVEKAVALASDIPALARLRETIRPRFVGSPMCEAPRFARNWEAAMRGMWQRWCAEQPQA